MNDREIDLSMIQLVYPTFFEENKLLADDS